MPLHNRFARRFGGALALAFVVSLFSVGCGKPTTAHVSGKVYLPDGKPMPGGNVVFYPTEGKTRPSTAEIGTDGSYDMPTAPTGKVKIGVNNIHLKDGVAAPVGKGAMPVPKIKGGKQPPKDLGGVPKDSELAKPTGADPSRYVKIDPKFSDPEKSGLTYEVKAGDQQYDIKLPK